MKVATCWVWEWVADASAFWGAIMILVGLSLLTISLARNQDHTLTVPAVPPVRNREHTEVLGWGTSNFGEDKALSPFLSHFFYVFILQVLCFKPRRLVHARLMLCYPAILQPCMCFPFRDSLVYPRLPFNSLFRWGWLWTSYHPVCTSAAL